MNKLALATAAALLSAGCGGDPAALQSRLVTGRSIPATMPVVRQAVGSLPMNMVLSPDRRFALVSDMGYRQALTSIDVRTGRAVSEMRFEHTKKLPTRGLYYGLAVADDGTAYAACGGDATIAVLKWDADVLRRRDRRGRGPLGIRLVHGHD